MMGEDIPGVARDVLRRLRCVWEVFCPPPSGIGGGGGGGAPQVVAWLGLPCWHWSVGRLRLPRVIGTVREDWMAKHTPVWQFVDVLHTELFLVKMCSLFCFFFFPTGRSYFTL